jgi:hypothetical protein
MTARLRIGCSTTELLWRCCDYDLLQTCMLWRGLEPRRLAAPPPQDGVSTNFTTRARGSACDRVPAYCTHTCNLLSPILLTGATGLEPATSRVTVECSNQTELRPPCLPKQALHLHLRTVAPTGIEPVSQP